MSLLWVIVATAGACADGYQSSTPVANATITVGTTPFAVSNWRYKPHTDPNSGKLEMVASNGNTCALMIDPNMANVRLVHVGAFSVSNIATGATATPSGPGLFPIEENATLGNAGEVWFYATGPGAQPLVLINQLANPTAPYADNGNVMISAFDPNTPDVIDGSALGSIQGASFYYTFTAEICP